MLSITGKYAIVCLVVTNWYSTLPFLLSCTWMWLCVHVIVCACDCVCVWLCLHVIVCACDCVCVCDYVYMWLCVCMWLCVHVIVCVCVWLCVHVIVCVCVCVCMCMLYVLVSVHVFVCMIVFVCVIVLFMCVCVCVCRLLPTWLPIQPSNWWCHCRQVHTVSKNRTVFAQNYCTLFWWRVIKWI